MGKTDACPEPVRSLRTGRHPAEYRKSIAGASAGHRKNANWASAENRLRNRANFQENRPIASRPYRGSRKAACGSFSKVILSTLSGNFSPTCIRRPVPRNRTHWPDAGLNLNADKDDGQENIFYKATWILNQIIHVRGK